MKRRVYFELEFKQCLDYLLSFYHLFRFIPYYKTPHIILTFAYTGKLLHLFHAIGNRKVFNYFFMYK